MGNLIKGQIKKDYSSSKIDLVGASQSVKNSLEIPVTTINTEIIKNRKLSIFESIIFELHVVKKYSITEISIMLNRDVNTVSTVYRRAKLKIEKNNSIKIK